MMTDCSARTHQRIDLVISDTPVIIRQLHWPGFRRLALGIRRAATGAEVVDLVNEAPPDALIMQARMPDQDAFEVLEQLRRTLPDLPVVVVSLHGVFHDAEEQADKRTAILTAPLSRGQIFDAITPLLGMRPRGEYDVTVKVPQPKGTPLAIPGRVTHLAVSGARLVLPQSLEERVQVSLHLQCSAGEMELPGRVIWCRSRSLRSEELRQRRPQRRNNPGGDAELSVQFTDLGEETRSFLRRVTTWELSTDASSGRQRVHLLRGLTEMSDLSELPDQLADAVDFDLSQVNVVYSVGITRWIKFLRRIRPAVDYRFKCCSTAFCLEASAFGDLFGRGEVLSAYAPYCCTSCAYEGERLIHIAEMDMSSFPPKLPGFDCPWCESQMHLDDLPERYFAFLRPREK